MLLHDTRRLLFRRDRETNRQIRRHTQTHRVQTTFTVSIHNHSRHHTYKHFHTTWPIPSMQRAHPLLNVLTTPPLSFLPPCLPPPLFMASRCCHDRASVAHDHDHASASSHRQPLPSLAWSSSWPSTAAAAALSLSRCCCCCCCCCHAICLVPPPVTAPWMHLLPCSWAACGKARHSSCRRSPRSSQLPAKHRAHKNRRQTGDLPHPLTTLECPLRTGTHSLTHNTCTTHAATNRCI